MTDCTFLFIDLEFKLSGYEICNAFHNTLSSFLALEIYDKIIGVPDKMQSSFLQFLIQFIKNYIGKQWGKRATLCKEKYYAKKTSPSLINTVFVVHLLCIIFDLPQFRKP